MTRKRQKTIYVVFNEDYATKIEGVFSTEKKVQKYMDKVQQTLMTHVRDHSTVRIIEDPDNAVCHRYFKIEADCPSYGFHVEECKIYGSEDIDKEAITSVWAVTSFAEPWVSYLFMNKNDAKNKAKDVKDIIGGQKVFVEEYKIDEYIK
jgi:hypothetical protein